VGFVWKEGRELRGKTLVIPGGAMNLVLWPRAGQQIPRCARNDKLEIFRGT
jgi:hypothetical protein